MPGSLEEAIPRLRSLLLLTDEANGRLDNTVAWPTNDRTTTLRNGLHGLGRCGLIRRVDPSTVELTESARAWIVDGDELQLIRILHENVQFIGELLYAISNSSDGLTHEEIRVIATEAYRLSWKNIQPARKWTSWLRAAGCVFLRFNSRIEITDVGRELLGQLKTATPEDVNGPNLSPLETDDFLAGPGLIKAAVNELDYDRLQNRSFGYGYIPRPMGSTIPGTMRTLMAMVGVEVERSQFVANCAETFALSEPLAPRPLTTLMILGFVVQTDATRYSATEIGREWLESGSDLDLVRIFHAKLAVVGELLDAVEFYDKAPELSRYASRVYGFRHDVDGIRIRLHLLTACGLLQEYALGRFRLTTLGETFRGGLPRLQPDESSQNEEDMQPSDRTKEIETRRYATLSEAGSARADVIADELMQSAFDSSHPERLEAAVRDAFSYLGFGAELLGGSGRTDVLVSFSVSPGETVVVAVDAKSASSGVVAEGSINFDTIAEHKEQHSATLSCLVGPSFHQSRIPKRAKERGVALLETDLLASAVRKQDSMALSTRDLAKIFDANLSPETSLADSWRKAERKNRLFSSVIVALSREAQEIDVVTKGSLTPDHLYVLLRSDLESKPDLIEIQRTLSLLTSPLIESATETSGNYVITERPATIARKLRALALAVEMAADLI